MSLTTFQKKLEQYKLFQEKKNKKTKPKDKQKGKQKDKTKDKQKDKPKGQSIKEQELLFKKEARKIFRYKYDYSNSGYTNKINSIRIICPKHGEFFISPYAHLNGRGCPHCNPVPKHKITDPQYIQMSIEKHGKFYIYSKVKDAYISEKVCIICPEHGEFWISPNDHLNGKGCPHCYTKKLDDKNKIFSDKGNKVHNNKYDYSKSEYEGTNKKVCIICPEHGEFWQTPSAHLKGKGCPKCGGTFKHTNETYIQKAISIHGVWYDYSKLNYTGANEKVCIICPEHGEFWQIARNHLSGCGCPVCSQSGHELQVRQMLKDNNINFIPQKKFDWLRYKRNLYLDFYLPDYNIAIECQGGFHYKNIEKYGGRKKLNKVRKRDRIKRELCKENNVNLIYYGDEEYGNDIITDLNELLDRIKNNNKI